MNADENAVLALVADLSALGDPAGPLPDGRGSYVEGGAYLTTRTMQGVLAEPMAAGDVLVATVTLDVAAVPGVYHVWWADGTVVDEAGCAGNVTNHAPLTTEVAP